MMFSGRAAPAKHCHPWQLGLLKVWAICASAWPFLWSEDTLIDTHYLHGLLAIGAWGLLLVQLGCLPSRLPGRLTIGFELLGGLSLLAGGVVIFLGHRAPWALSLLLVLMACAVALQWAVSSLGRDLLARALMKGLAIAALWNAFVAVVQFLLPFQTDGVFMAFAQMTGRSMGNLYQPNHLANLCLLGLGGCLYLAVPGSRWRNWWWPAAWLLCGGVVLSGSRMGLVGLLMLVVWGLTDVVRGRDLAWARLAVVPLASFWFALRWALATSSGLAIFEGYHGPVVDPSNVEALTSARNVIWRHAWVLLQEHPWTGVGWGQFGAYWALTPLEGRGELFVGHAHNLFLHLAVEMGLPFALALLGFTAWFAFRTLMFVPASSGDQWGRWCLLYLGAVTLLHSQLEFPLWYPYFLLPFAALCGLLGRDVFFVRAPSELMPEAMSRSTLGWLRSGVAVGVGSLAFLAAIHAWHDYRTRLEPFLSCFQCAPQTRAALVMKARSSLWFSEAGVRGDLFSKESNLKTANLADFGPLLIRMPEVSLLFVLGRTLEAQGHLSHADHIANRLREFPNNYIRAALKTCEQDSHAFFCRKPAPDLSPEEVLHMVGAR